MFKGESPENFEQKCLCVLTVDVSSSMSGDAINQLNEGLKVFQQDVLMDFVAAKRLEVSIVTFGSNVLCIQDPSSVSNFRMPVLQAHGTTKMVDGVRMAMDIVEQRKDYYRATGQNYFRPMIVLISDGEPDADQDIDGLSRSVSSAIAAKQFMFFSLGVDHYNHNTLNRICSTPPPKSLRGHEFASFFKWLSNSIGIISKSAEGQRISLPSTTGWEQIEL
jgi:uncharacterized protein YegL